MNPFWAKVTKASNDEGPYRLLEVDAHDNPIDVTVISVGGSESGPMVGGQVLLFPIDGDLGKAVGFCMPPPSDRQDKLKEGEVQTKNYKAGRGQTVKLDDDGNISLSSPNGIVHINPPE
jgi:phage gp45-like